MLYFIAHVKFYCTVYTCCRPAFTSVCRGPGDTEEVSEVAMTIKWTYDTGRCVDASPLVAMGDQAPPTVYIGSHSGMFVALCVLSGRCLWEVQLSDRIESSACLLLNGARVVVGALRNNLRTKVFVRNFHDFAQGLPCGLVVRIPGFHPGGPGSIPGMGTLFFLLCPSI